MIKEMQERRIEHELKEIKEYSKSNLVKVKKLSKDEYSFEVKIKKEETSNDELHEDITFDIHMMNNYPICPPRVYCRTQFSFPSIADGRDILEDIVGNNWNSNNTIMDIINKLTTFVSEFLKNLSEGVLMLVGSYYLNERYDLNLFNGLPLCKLIVY